MIEQQLQLPDGVPPLNGYYLYLTAGCNLACRHCWLAPQYQPNGGTGGHLDYQLFELAIDEGLSLGLSYVKLTGGEPLLHPDFPRMVELLRKKELGLNIETNGVLLTPAVSKFLSERSTLYHISISLDGATPETHDDFRGVQGSFEKSCQAIRNLAEVGYRPQVIMSIHNGNVGEVELLVRLAERLGAGSVKFNLVQPTGRGEVMVDRKQVLDIRHLIEVGNWVDKLQHEVSIRLFYSWPMAFRSIHRLLRGDGAATCGIFNILGILPNGQLAMCGIGTEIPELCYGQLGEDRLADVWYKHPALLDLRQSLPNQLEGICSNCIHQQQCLGSCVAQNYHQANRLTGSFWFCQQAEASGLFPLSRLHQHANAVS